MVQDLPLIFSRARLVDFLTCPRRFELRYLRRLVWPAAPLDEKTAVSLQQGQQFHNLLERRFLHLPINIGDHSPTIRSWYNIFQQNKTMLPNGEYLPELTLTVPIGNHFLTGRFDLLVQKNDHLHLFDWKTGRPRNLAALHADWQTRLYLAMIVESGQAITPAPITPENVSMTYWYVNEPNSPHHIRYDAAWHERNWAEIEEIVVDINGRLTTNIWEKTTDSEECRNCPYQIYCSQRSSAPLIPRSQPLPAPPQMEPNSP